MNSNSPPAARRNPLFVGSGSLYALGYILQLCGGSPHSFNSQGWDAFGRTLVEAFKRHVEKAGLNEKIQNLSAVNAWVDTADATEFFNQYVPAEHRGKRYAFW